MKQEHYEMMPIGRAYHWRSCCDDWAIVDLDGLGVLPRQLNMPSNRYNVRSFAGMVNSSRRVYALTTRGRVEGFVSATPSFITLPGQRRPVATLLAHLEQSLGE